MSFVLHGELGHRRGTRQTVKHGRRGRQLKGVMHKTKPATTVGNRGTASLGPSQELSGMHLAVSAGMYPRGFRGSP